MSEYTPEDFANAGFAVNVDGRRAMRMNGGHWRTSKAELYPHVVLAEEAGWRPVMELEDPEGTVDLIGRQAARIRELEGEAAPLTLDTLREAWENAEQSKDCREGDTLIESFAPGSYHLHSAPRDHSSLPPAVRVHERAPQPEPWQDLADVLGTNNGELIGEHRTITEVAKALHERGVRVVGGDER